VVAEDVRNLENWTGHQRRASSGRLVLLDLADEMIERLQKGRKARIFTLVRESSGESRLNTLFAGVLLNSNFSVKKKS
jgi:hypothetical protein